MTDIAGLVDQSWAPDGAHEQERPPRWQERPTVRTLVALLMGAMAFDFASRVPVGLITVVSLSLLLSAVIVGGWAQERTGKVCLVAAAGPMLMLLVRASWWLVPLNVIAVLGLVLLASELRDEERAVPRAVGRLLRPTPALMSMVSWPVLLMEVARSSLRFVAPWIGGAGSVRNAGAALRGFIITVPVIVVLLGLLAWSDALFGSLFSVPGAPANLASHGSRLVVGGVLTSLLAVRALRQPVEDPLRITPQLRGLELAMLLGGVAAVYTLFVAVQIVAALAGASYVQETTGLTVAEYARSGFFQLLAAAALTLGVLTAGKRHAGEMSDRARRVVQLLGQITIVLTLATVVVAIRRLMLYEAEFGLTMLRLYTIIFAGWIAVVFLLTGLHLADRLPVEHVTAVLGTAFVFLMAVNLANPEAIVADRNLDRFAGADLDRDYLVRELGPDSVPRLLEEPAMVPSLCNEFGRPDNSLLHFNHSRRQAFAALSEVCPEGWGSGYIFD